VFIGVHLWPMPRGDELLATDERINADRSRGEFAQDLFVPVDPAGFDICSRKGNCGIAFRYRLIVAWCGERDPHRRAARGAICGSFTHKVVGRGFAESQESSANRQPL
jgi:hypothetical protein